MATPDPSPFGELLRKRRVAAHLTQEALAEAAGVSTRAITDLERGIIRAPRRDTLELLADALGLLADEREEWKKLRDDLSIRVQDGRSSYVLPVPPNKLIGRERELNALKNLLEQEDTRLITVTGPGGVGKTRIALETGHKLVKSFRDGVYFVELASLRDPTLLLPTIAQRLGLRAGNPDSARVRIKTVLSRRQVLLILDNMEHLRSAAVEVAELLAHTETPTLLITSRSGLRIRVEREFPVSPLGLPEWETEGRIEQIAAYPAIQLFVQRAGQVRPEFELTSENAAAISAICSYLDGIPLALELAAARVRILSPNQMLARLADRLNFLTDGLIDAPGRHRTMRAAIAWSYDLLSPEDQRAFRHLSIFIGGWTLEAAEAVGDMASDTFDVLGRLANDNLIRQSFQPNGEVRFAMLETIREFGIEQLDVSGEREHLARRHSEYLLRLAESSEEHIRGTGQIEWLNLLGKETANLRAALEWSLGPNGDHEMGLRMVAALTWYWESRGHVSEARIWLDRALERENHSQVALIRALSGAGWMAHIQHDSAQATTLLTRSIALARETRQEWWVSWNLHLLGRVCYFEGDSETACRYADESLEIARELNDRWLIAWAHHLYGLAALIDGKWSASRAHFAESLKIREAIGYLEGICLIKGLTGIVELNEGDLDHSLTLLQEALSISDRLGARWLVVNWISNIVFIAASWGDAERAARLAGYVDALSQHSGALPIPLSDSTFHAGCDLAREQLNGDEFRLFFQQGKALSMDQAISEASQVGSSAEE